MKLPMNVCFSLLAPRLQFLTCKFGSTFGEIFGRGAMRALFMTPILWVLAVVAGLAPVVAQDWPSRTVRLILPFGPGPAPDMGGRLGADPLQQKLGHSFGIENKAGVGGNLGPDAVAKAEPDGGTLGISIG